METTVEYILIAAMVNHFYSMHGFGGILPKPELRRT